MNRGQPSSCRLAFRRVLTPRFLRAAHIAVNEPLGLCVGHSVSCGRADRPGDRRGQGVVRDVYLAERCATLGCC
jgi:hypothetical protein